VKISASLLFLTVALAGCASFTAKVDPQHDLGTMHRFFVQSTLNDNHGLDRVLVTALQARGLTAERGPATMKPSDADAVLIYADSWNWDFKDHMMTLNLELRDGRTNKPVAYGAFDGPAALRLTTEQVVTRLLEDMLRPGAGTPKKS